MASVAKLEDALQHVHSLTKTALTKELASVVRASQGASRASWKSAQRPNWWEEGRHVSTDNVDHAVPVFGPLKSQSADDMRAALVTFYKSRIYFEQHVRGSPNEATYLEEDCNDGKNPFPPEHYAQNEDEPAEEEAEEQPEEQSEEQPDEAKEDEVMEEVVDVEPDKEDEVTEKVVAKEDDDGENSESENEDEQEDDTEYDVNELDAYAKKLKRGAPDKMLAMLQTKLEEFMDAMDSKPNGWTSMHEEYKMRVAFHLCCAKMLCDLASMKQEDDPEYVSDLRALRKELVPMDPSKSLRSRLQSRYNLDLAASDDDDDEDDEEEKQQEDEEEEEEEEIPPPKQTRRPRKAAVQSGFITPVSDNQRVQRARAASRALKAGTPSRNMKKNEVLYDANGNPVEVLFSAKGSPILITESVAKPKRGRKSRLPPPTPATTAAAGTRRSKRNKR